MILRDNLLERERDACTARYCRDLKFCHTGVLIWTQQQEKKKMGKGKKRKKERKGWGGGWDGKEDRNKLFNRNSSFYI